MRRLKYRLRPQGLIIACSLWGVLGCSTPDTVGLSLPPTKPDSNISNLPVHHDTAVVDTSGAVITAGEAEVVIPQGALAEPVEIVVQTVQATAAAGLQTFPEAENETILQFLPHGTQFLKPVTIQVPHHHVVSDDLVLYTSEPNELWAPVAGATFTDEFAKADVMHFSFFFTSPKPPPPSALVPESRPPEANNGGAGGAPPVDEAKGGSGGEPNVDPVNGQAGATSTGAAGEGGAAGDTGNDPGPIVGADAGVKDPPPDTDPGAGGAGSGSGDADAGVAGGGGVPNSDPGVTSDAGTSTGGGNDPPPMQLDYLMDGAWHGYLYSAADDTSFVDRSGMCASGIVSANPQFQSFALWGWNLNQDQQGPVLSWDPTMQMMHYDVVSSTPVRLSLRDADGKDWCYVLPNAGGDVSFTSFNSACWDDSGDFYNGTTPLVSLNVMVPGDDNTDVPFDLCVKDLFAENEPFTGDPGGGTAGASGTGGAGGAGGAGTGGAGTGTGGAGTGGAGTGTGGAGTGTGGAPPVTDPDYLQNADWRGYMFTASDANSSIDRSGVCASGVVAIDPQSQSFAAWGWNLNQDLQGPALSWDPTMQMMHYELHSTVPVRLSLRDADGKDWCYVLPGQQGDVSFADFNSACWDNSGDFYNGTTPLVSLSVVVPGNDTTEVPFDLCVQDLFPEDEPFVPPPPPPPPSSDYMDNGYWRGDMFSVADPTSSVERVGQCAAGTITSNPQFQSFGGWGWNLNQDKESLPLSWDPTLPMMHYDVDSTTPLRLSVRDADGKDWCYVLPDARGDVSFTAFNSACWDNSGDFYNGTTPLVSIGTIVPGNDTTNVDFQLCVNELYPEFDAAPPPPPPPPPPMQLDYRDIGDWQGHLYSVADDTSFVDRSGMCANGIVAANAQFQSYALWGWNLNQQPDEPALAWDPTLQSIHYFIGSSTPLRLSLRDEQGQDWCYPIDTTTGDVLLTQFNSACWDNSGAFYDGATPLMSINVVVPGNDIADVDFNFCVSDLFPQDPGSVGGGSGGTAGAGGVGGAPSGGSAGAGGVGGAPSGGAGGSAGAPGR